MPIETDIRGYIDRVIKTLDQMPVDALARLSEMLYRAYSDGKQVFTLGNGGSGSTASHMAADLGKNTIGPNMRRFRIISLNDNIPLLTALSNDLGYENVFAEQLQNLIQPGDVLIVLSGSGRSPNVLGAMEYARSRSAQVAALLGFDGGPAVTLADLSILVESDDYGVIEDAHLIINHILVEHFRRRLADERPWSSSWSPERSRGWRSSPPAATSWSWFRISAGSAVGWSQKSCCARPSDCCRSPLRRTPLR